MKIFLRAHTFDEWQDPRADYALVDITKSMAASYIWMIDHVNELKVMRSGIYGISIFDYSPTWYGYCEAADELLGDGTEYEILPTEKFKSLEGGEIIRQDATTVVIQDDGVLWHSYIKHTNVTIETSQIPLSVLKECMNEEEEITA